MTPEERAQARRLLARLGIAMIMLGGGVVILGATNGAFGGLVLPPGIIIILLGVMLVVMSTGVDRGEVRLGEKRAGFALGRGSGRVGADADTPQPSVRVERPGADAASRALQSRRRGRCRWLSRDVA